MIKFNDFKSCLLKDEVILKSQQRFNKIVSIQKY